MLAHSIKKKPHIIPQANEKSYMIPAMIINSGLCFERQIQNICKVSNELFRNNPSLPLKVIIESPFQDLFNSVLKDLQYFQYLFFSNDALSH